MRTNFDSDLLARRFLYMPPGDWSRSATATGWPHSAIMPVWRLFIPFDYSLENFVTLHGSGVYILDHPDD